MHTMAPKIQFFEYQSHASNMSTGCCSTLGQYGAGNLHSSSLATYRHFVRMLVVQLTDSNVRSEADALFGYIMLTNQVRTACYTRLLNAVGNINP